MKKLTLAIIAVLGMSFGALAQGGAGGDTKTDNHTITITIPEVALLDIELSGSKNISTAFTSPTEAGLRIVAPTSGLNSLWLNYSSVVNPSGPDASRTVSVSSSSLIPGTVLNVSAGTPVITGGGSGGSPVAITAITTTPQTIISGIGSVYTGDGVSSGSNITYALTAPAATYGSLLAGATVLTLTYTLSDN
jgi:hypothetical protein